MKSAAAMLKNFRIRILKLAAFVLLTVFIVGINFSLNPGYAYTQEPINPAKVRTAYLYHFMRFTEWPESVKPDQGDTYTICVPDTDIENEFLELITKKAVNDQPISISYIGYDDSLSMCHILYLAEAKPLQVKAYINNAAGMPILTVGNGLKFLGMGGMIAFNVRKGQVTFSVNLKATSKVDLKISANMLDVAEKVIK